MLPIFDGAKCLLLAGSGGTGKTTLAAAWALKAVQTHPRVLCLTVDPSQRLKDFFGLQANGSATFSSAWLNRQGCATASDLDDALTVQILDPEEALNTLITTFASPTVAARIMQNPLYQAICGQFAGTHAYMAVDALYQAHTRARYDMLVVDTPPDTDALDILKRPDQLRLLENISSLVPRFIPSFISRSIKGIASGLSQLTGTTFLEDTRTLMVDFLETLKQMRQRATMVDALLKSPQTHTWVVTRPHKTLLNNAQRLVDAYHKMHMPVSGVVINTLHPYATHEPDKDARLLAAIRTLAASPLRTAIEHVAHEELRLAKHQRDDVQQWKSTLTRKAIGLLGVARCGAPMRSLADLLRLADMTKPLYDD